jgi:hypothetical protein
MKRHYKLPLLLGRGEGRKLRYNMTNFVWNRPFWCRVFITLQCPFSNKIVIRIKIDLFTIFPQHLFVSEWMIVCLKKSSKKATNAKFSHGVVTYFYRSEHIANKTATRSTTRGFLFKWKHTFKQALVNVYFRYFFYPLFIFICCSILWLKIGNFWQLIALKPLKISPHTFRPNYR